MSYIRKKIYLSDSQKTKIKSALQKGISVTLRINRFASPNYDILLTATQISQIAKGKEITLSKTQLAKNGGFLPFLFPLLAALGTGVASGAAGWGTKKVLDKIAGQGVIQNWEGQGLKKKRKRRRGKGILQNWEFPMKR